MSKNLRKLSKKCDDLFSKLIRKAGKCHRCGEKNFLQTAHIISRRYHNTRWDLSNALCLCRGCHVYFTWHPLEWEIYAKEVLGSGYEAMKRIALATPIKHNYEKLIERLKGKL